MLTPGNGATPVSDCRPPNDNYVGLYLGGNVIFAKSGITMPFLIQHDPVITFEKREAALFITQFRAFNKEGDMVVLIDNGRFWISKDYIAATSDGSSLKSTVNEATLS